MCFLCWKWGIYCIKTASCILFSEYIGCFAECWVSNEEKGFCHLSVFEVKLHWHILLEKVQNSSFGVRLIGHIRSSPQPQSLERGLYIWFASMVRPVLWTTKPTPLWFSKNVLLIHAKSPEKLFSAAVPFKQRPGNLVKISFVSMQ